MSDALQGYLGVLKVSTAVGSTPAKVAEVRNFDLLVEAQEIDATSHDSSGDDENIMGQVSWSGTAESLHLQGDAGQQALHDMLVTGAKMDFEFYTTDKGGGGFLSGSGYLDEWELAAPNDDAAAVSLAFVGDGVMDMWTGPLYPKVTSGLFQLDSTDTGLRFDVSGGLFTVASSGLYMAVMQISRLSSAAGRFQLMLG